MFLLCTVLPVAIFCLFAVAQSPEETLKEVYFEKVFHNKDIVHFQRAAFPYGETSFLTTDGVKTISLWKKPFMEPYSQISIKEHSSLSALCFTEDNHHILFASVDGTVQLWDSDLKSKEFEHQFSGPAKQVSISANNRFIAANGELYDRQKKALVGQSVAHASYNEICFGGGNLVITSGYHDHGVAIRNIHDGRFDYRRSPHPVTGAAVSPDEKVVVAVGRKGRCYLWRLPESEPMALVIPRGMHSLRFSPDSRWFVVFGGTFAQIFQTDPPTRMGRLHVEAGIDALQAASANLIAIGDKSGFVQIHDATNQRIISRHKVCANGIYHLQLIPDKELLWAAGRRIDRSSGNIAKGEIVLYRVHGLAAFFQPRPAAN